MVFKGTKLVIILVLSAMVSACVTTQKYNRLNAELMRTDNDRIRLSEENARLSSDLDRTSESLAALRTESDSLEARYGVLDGKYIRAEKALADIRNSSGKEMARMMDELSAKEALIAEREAKMSELEDMIRNRDEALGNIRKQVADALTGFEGKGLTVTQREGNVYVSMEDKLLFRSGSFDIDPEGERAVKELSSVLASNKDINIVVEGHTDDVPYKGTGVLKDNLDLSVKRATTVSRLLLENKGINPSRVSSSGRGEFLPVAPGSSTEARQKNRRTEIILTPKIAELIKIIEQ